MELTIIRPDDWHLHLRDGDLLKTTVKHTAAQFNRAIVMPNLKPPVTTTALAKQYKQRIMAEVASNSPFTPLMTLYLTNNTTADDIAQAKQSGIVYGVKLYPAGATTNSDAGVTDISYAYDAIAAMEEHDLPLLIHGEITRPEIDIFDREKCFIDEILDPLSLRFPKLRIVLEHITTKDAADFVKAASDNIAATITAHHLLLNRNSMLVGGMHPHYYCLPVLKRERHREALISAATSDSIKFFLGTDSAPHAQAAKESACGCAGIYTAHAAIELYAEAFEDVGALDRLEAFASLNGPDFYKLPRNTDHITLKKQSWQVPESYSFGESVTVPLRANETIAWQVINELSSL